MKNGKAFEFAIADAYENALRKLGIRVFHEEDEPYSTAREMYYALDVEERKWFDKSAEETFDTLTKLEAGLTAQAHSRNDVLKIRIASDREGQMGDVRDIIFSRAYSRWEIGISAKNNNDAVKHSRLSGELDFGESWFGVPCSRSYWEDIRPIFSYINKTILRYPRIKWNDIGDDKISKVYLPLLRAFRKEILHINANYEDIPKALISYLIGKYPFYKVIKDDAHRLVILKAFNLDNKLSQKVNGMPARHKATQINYPSRIVELELLNGSDTTLGMIMDGGWEVSFRIHSASTLMERSLKFDINLLGNPPVLFSQYLFQ